MSLLIDALDAGSGFMCLLQCQAAQALTTGRPHLLFGSFKKDPVPVHILRAPLAQLPKQSAVSSIFPAIDYVFCYLPLGKRELDPNTAKPHLALQIIGKTGPVMFRYRSLFYRPLEPVR
jgi:hypothetical protein